MGQGVFEPLKDPAAFARVGADEGTATWECGADIDPLVLYSLLTRTPIPWADDEWGPEGRFGTGRIRRRSAG